jgi:hypothetical protein
MLAVVKKVDNRFILNLNKKLYREDLVKKLAVEDKDWVKKMPSQEKYLCLEFRTKKIKQVLEWANYLLYMSKTS